MSCSCKSEEADPPQAQKQPPGDARTLPELKIPAAPTLAPPTLVPSSVPGFDLLTVPTKARFEKADDRDRWYSIETGLEDLIEFYRDQGFEVVRNQRGATVRVDNKTSVLHIARGKGRRYRLGFISLADRQKDPPGKTRVPDDIPPELAEKIRKALEAGDPDVDKLFPTKYQR